MRYGFGYAGRAMPAGKPALPAEPGSRRERECVAAWGEGEGGEAVVGGGGDAGFVRDANFVEGGRSEERRVGKEC